MVGWGEGWPCGGITKYHQLYTSWKLSRQSQCFVSTGRTVTADNDKEAPGRDLYFPQTEHNIGQCVGCSYQCCDQRGADDRLGWCWSGAGGWCLLMKMLCDEQLGCGARGQAHTDLGIPPPVTRPWCRMSPLACTGHNTGNTAAHSPLLSALQTIILGLWCQVICRIGPFSAAAYRRHAAVSCHYPEQCHHHN